MRGIVEDLERGMRKMGFGVEIDEMMREKRNRL